MNAANGMGEKDEREERLGDRCGDEDSALRSAVRVWLLREERVSAGVGGRCKYWVGPAPDEDGGVYETWT